MIKEGELKIQSLNVSINAMEQNTDKNDSFTMSVSTYADGRTYNTMTVFPRNDLINLFDQIWMYLGEEVKKRITDDRPDLKVLKGGKL